MASGAVENHNKLHWTIYSLVSHGESVEDIELTGERVELKLYVRLIGEGQRRYLTARVDVDAVDEFAADVE